MPKDKLCTSPNIIGQREYRWWDDTTKLERLYYAWSIGSTDEEACNYAEISLRQLQYYQKQNPNFVEQKELLKFNPILKARKSVYDNLSNPKVAMWFLERKMSNEFGKAISQDSPKIDSYIQTKQLALTNEKVAGTIVSSLIHFVDSMTDNDFSESLDKYVREVYNIEPVRQV